MATLILLILLVFSSLAVGQQTTNRLDVVYSGATPGRIRGFEQGVPKSNYIDLVWPSSLAANYTVTMPKETSTLLAQENHFFGSAGSLAFYRANGTEASPTDVANGNVLFSFSGGARVGGSYTSAANLTYIVETASPLTTQIWLSTSNAGSYGVKLVIDGPGSLIPQSTSQDLGSTIVQWRSAYLDGSTPLNMDRAARTTSQRFSWTVAGSSSTDGAWLAGIGPNSSQSQFEIAHNGTLRLRVTEAAGVYLLDSLFPETTDTYSLGSATYQWNNLYVKYIDVEGDVQPKTNNTVPLGSTSLRFSKLWVTDIDCSGSCPGSSPPVVWDLDNTNTVLTLGTHGASGAFQLTQRHSRGTTASPTDTADNDRIGQVNFQLYGGGAYRDAAAIRAEADGTPSGTSSPARIGFFVTPAGSTTPVERLFLQQDGEFWVRSSMTADRGLYIQNDSASGYSSIAFADNGGTVKGYAGWNNASAGVNPGVFTVGTRTNDLLAFLQNDTVRWYVSSSGLYPNADGSYVIGSSSLKPSSITSRSYYTETAAAYGTQQNTFSADANLNLYLVSASSSAATDRASLQFYRYRNTVASPTTVASGDRLGNIAWVGYASGVNAVGAVIESYVNGTVSGGVLPAELRLRTTNNAGTLADRVIVSSAGITVYASGGVLPSAAGGGSLGGGGLEWANTHTNYLTLNAGAGYGAVNSIMPSADNSINLGSSSYRWANGHLVHLDVYDDIALISSSITRFYASASSVATFDSGGNTTTAINTATGELTTRNHVPQSSNTYALGSSSARWASVHTTSLDAYTDIAVIDSSISRVYLSSGAMLATDSGGSTTFQVTTSTGVVSSVGGYIANGSTGGSGTLTCGAGQAIKNLTFVLGIVVSASCGTP